MAGNKIVSMDLTYGGRPVEVLNRLIERRNRVFKGELMKQSAAAIAITALKSIRAATRKGKGKVLVK